MENRSHALIAGLFLLIFGASTIAALWWFDGQEESNHYVVETRENVTGLNVQGQVRYRGIRVGKVESILLDPADARVTLIGIAVRKDIPITRGTAAKLGYQGVTGIAHILLEDNGKDTIPLPQDKEGGVRIVMQSSLIQELADVGSEVLRQTRDLLAGMNDLLRPENRQMISRMLDNLETSSQHARETSERLLQVLNSDAIARINSILLHSEKTVAQASPFFAEARGLVARLNELTAEFESTSHQLNRVLRMLEESPQSLIFGRRAISPGPGETGFVTPSTRGNTQ
jgi:phospholipid/cholesterol/gamma-HCH transport system substrate-binding protein